MGCFRRLAFYKGLVLGMLTTAAAGAVVLSYLLTGKFPMAELGAERPTVRLMTADEIVATVRDQISRARTARASAQGGEGDE